jgi:hypothetical protein
MPPTRKGTQSAWLYEILAPPANEVIVITVSDAVEEVRRQAEKDLVEEAPPRRA